MDGDGCFRIVETQDCDGAISAIQDCQSNLNKNTKGARFMGTVPLVMAQQWAKECGYSIGSKGYNDYAIKKLKSSEFSKLRVSYT